MAKFTNPRKPTKQIHITRSSRSDRKGSQSSEQSKSEHKPPSWAVMKSILTCKDLQVEQLIKQKQENQESNSNKKIKKMRCSGSLCNNTKVMHKPTTEQNLQSASVSASSPDHIYRRKVSISSYSHSCSSSSAKSIIDQNASFGSSSAGVMASSSSSSSNCSSQNASGGGGAFRGMPFRKLSGCYECRMVVDPVLGFTRDPSLRATICSCRDCGEVFMKPDFLELHQTIKHAVSELGPEDTSRNIVEIIFQSSWLRKQAPVCKIDRILKVHNTNRTASLFEEYRDSIKAKATTLQKKHPRCIADGNELLRFHSTALMCSLGLNGSSNLCNSIPSCNVCSIIRDGFKPGGRGVLTTATSGRAHYRADVGGDHHGRAMLVCRVIAGRVKKAAVPPDHGGLGMDDYDSVAGVGGVFSNLDELYVHNPKAILPCFVVIYRGF